MTNRRTFHHILGSLLGASVAGVRAQPSNRLYRLGMLRGTGAPSAPNAFSAEVLLSKGLARLGYVEGRNLHLEYRYGDGDPPRLHSLARDLAQQGVDVILAVGSPAIRAAMEATTTIPIVFFNNSDSVAAGFVQSLARPGRNVTGVLITSEGTLGAKKLELLKAVVPSAHRAAVLGSDESIARTQMPELQQAATTLGIDLTLITLRNRDIGEAFQRIVATKPDVLFIIAESYFMINRRPVISHTLQYRLPSTCEWREQVQDGGLMSYGPSHRITMGAGRLPRRPYFEGSEASRDAGRHANESWPSS